MNRFSSAAVAALLALPLATPAVHAQDAAPDGGSISGSNETSTGADGADAAGNAGSGATPEAGASAPGADAGAGEAAENGPDIITDMSTVVVSVGDTDITAGQVRDMLSSMPPQVQTQPMELLVPLAVEELVMRELVLQAAETEGLADSPQVREMANGGASEEALENAMITTFLAERMQDVASDEAVQAAYDEAAANTTEEIPPLEEVRPQIEQQLQQRRLIEIRDELRSEFEVVYYGPDGEPREDRPDGMSIEGDGASSGETGSDGGSPGASGNATTGPDPSSGGSAPEGGSTGDSAPTGSDAQNGSDDATSGN